MLFRRSSRGIEPTEYGQRLINCARDITAKIADAEKDLRDMKEGRVGRISLGVLPAAAVHLIPRFIAKLEQEDVSTSVFIREGTMDALLPGLRVGEFDIIVGTLPQSPLGPEYATEVLMDEQIIAVARRGHPLERSSKVSWQDIQKFPMVLPPPTTMTRGAIDATFSRHSTRILHTNINSTSTMTNIGTLQLTDSIGFLTRSLARHFSDLSELHLEVPGIQLHVGLVWMVDRPQTNSHRLTRRLMQIASSEVLGMSGQQLLA
ncbi:LysR substrate-binding domain-containing protein [Bradyrhizobium sp. Cp5.3]|uniref:LysR substrate-binding domain-containing protein n=1 Tax=Bradyrhizobium sp. Cp5.3 TaxID=443598 RepID=UPI00054D5419|nr:LysR substrate-binding domain-containing protein [Bradyrhizobium sp. Cp5.3]